MDTTPHHSDLADVIDLRPRVPVASVQGTLALELQPLLEPPPAEPPALRGDVVAVDVRARHEFQRFVHRVCVAVVEVVGGDRPVSQLMRWSTPEVYADLGRRAQLVARAVGRQPGQGGVQGIRPQVLGTRISFVNDDAVEVSVHVRYGLRSRAVAARFELRHNRWQICALEFA
ncbi:MAG: Rv3235 family protein [Nocardioides sp.]